MGKLQGHFPPTPLEYTKSTRDTYEQHLDSLRDFPKGYMCAEVVTGHTVPSDPPPPTYSGVRILHEADSDITVNFHTPYPSSSHNTSCLKQMPNPNENPPKTYEVFTLNSTAHHQQTPTREGIIVLSYLYFVFPPPKEKKEKKTAPFLRITPCIPPNFRS